MAVGFTSILDKQKQTSSGKLNIKGISLKQENGIQTIYNNDLILERIGRIIMTYKGERVNNPVFGSLLETFLFNREVSLRQHVESELIYEIEKYEPRITVTSAKVTAKGHEAYIRIEVVRNDTLEKLVYSSSIDI